MNTKSQILTHHRKEVQLFKREKKYKSNKREKKYKSNNREDALSNKSSIFMMVVNNIVAVRCLLL
jgi:hypothetical protein